MFGYSQSENMTSRVDESTLPKRRRAERGSSNESVLIKRGLSQHLTSLKRRACSVATSRAFALLVIKLAASPPEQSIKNVALRSGGGQVSLSSLIFYRKSGKKTSLGLFFLKCKWLSGIIFEELHLTCFHLRRLPRGLALQLQKCVGWGGGGRGRVTRVTWISKNFWMSIDLTHIQPYFGEFIDASCLFICIISENKHLLKEMGRAD